MRLSLQLYTLRDDLARDLTGTLDAVRDIGLKYVEFAGYYGLLALEWRDLLDARGLKVSAAHIGLDDIKKDFDKVVGDCKTLGCDYVVVPWIGEEHYNNGWDKFGLELTPYAERLKAEGLQMAYHNHAFEFKTDGLNVSLRLGQRRSFESTARFGVGSHWGGRPGRVHPPLREPHSHGAFERLRPHPNPPMAPSRSRNP